MKNRIHQLFLVEVQEVKSLQFLNNQNKNLKWLKKLLRILLSKIKAKNKSHKYQDRNQVIKDFQELQMLELQQLKVINKNQKYSDQEKRKLILIDWIVLIMKD